MTLTRQSTRHAAGPMLSCLRKRPSLLFQRNFGSSANGLHDIVLSDAEASTFSFLRNTARSRQPHVVLRVAGGWVRNKLLGLSSSDIDIAVEGRNGFEMLDLVEEYHRTFKPVSLTNCHRVNDGPSKELMTSTCIINNLRIDFMGLRSDVYSELSRVPTTVRLRLNQQLHAHIHTLTPSCVFSLTDRSETSHAHRGCTSS